ncbi:MAG TPA: hypothetical protein VGJ26_04320 [Pirellulales bacterium]
MNKPEVLNGMVSDLIRRGLPADYATRAAAEFADHHRDLVEELQATGFSESQAQTEASRRLGDTRTLVKKTTRAYQRRYWCARWPLLTFLLAPIPAVVATWYVSAIAVSLVFSLLGILGFVQDAEPSVTLPMAAPLTVKYVVLVTFFLVMPSAVTYAFARLAKRAALGWQWIILAAVVMGLFVGNLKWERIGPGSSITMTDRETLRQIPQPRPDFVIMIPICDPTSWSWSGIRRWYTSNAVQSCQLLFPAAVAGMLLLRGRQLALRRERLFIVGC